jgi:hypothetical protein
VFRWQRERSTVRIYPDVPRPADARGVGVVVCGPTPTDLAADCVQCLGPDVRIDPHAPRPRGNAAHDPHADGADTAADKLTVLTTPDGGWVCFAGSADDPTCGSTLTLHAPRAMPHMAHMGDIYAFSAGPPISFTQSPPGCPPISFAQSPPGCPPISFAQSPPGLLPKR